ncbi:hypothetical protein [Enterobacter asburiae]|uniref:hypothetical protein n=1 Tax=Enterobacter asburiae TaxID=61645 RepID=UPI003F56B8D7
MASLIEFIEQVGIENTACQVLHECLTSAKSRKGGDTEVSFITREFTPSDMVGKSRKTAFIVWIDADRFDAALKELRDK